MAMCELLHTSNHHYFDGNNKGPLSEILQMNPKPASMFAFSRAPAPARIVTPEIRSPPVDHRPRRWRTRWTCIACHCLPLAVLMPRRLSSSAAARIDRCTVSAMAPRTASARPRARCHRASAPRTRPDADDDSRAWNPGMTCQECRPSTHRSLGESKPIKSPLWPALRTQVRTFRNGG
jgi:hypothetical protein